MMLHRHGNENEEIVKDYVFQKAKATALSDWLEQERKPERHVLVTSGTGNTYRYMAGSIKSYIANSDVDRIFVLIEDDEFRYEMPEMVSFINVREQQWFPKSNPNKSCKFTYMAMIRSALCHIFPEYDQILCVDYDTVAIRDMSELFDITVSDDCYFAACHEPLMSRSQGIYYTNAGVMIHNLKKLRDGMADLVIEELNSCIYFFGEQDVMNHFCQGHIQDLDSIWNGCDFVDKPSGEVRIEHYAGQKQWEMRHNMWKYIGMPWHEVLAEHEKHTGYERETV